MNMGLFNRGKKQEIQRDTTPQTEPQNNYPLGLSFDLARAINSDNNCLSAFYGGIELITNSLASVPILIKDVETNSVIKDSPLNNIFSSVNIPKFLLIKGLISDAYKYGNGFAYIKRSSNGQPVQIIYRPHGCVSIVWNSQTQKLYYIDNVMSTKKIEPVNMIHIRKNSLDAINGVSISKVGNKIFSLAKATDDTAKDFFDSGCNVSGVLTSNKPLNPKAKEEVLADWRAAFNSSKANNVGVLGYDLHYTPVSNNANDSQLLQSREFNVLEIARYLQINPLLLGVQKGGSAYGSLESAQRDLIIHTLMPWICLIEEEFNNKLILPSEKSKIYIDFDEDKIVFSSRSDTANYYSSLVKNGIISINEARMALGYGERDGAADDLIIPYTDVNQNKVDGEENGEDKPKDEPSEEDES